MHHKDYTSFIELKFKLSATQPALILFDHMKANNTAVFQVAGK